MRAVAAVLCVLMISMAARGAETLSLGEPGRTKFATFDAATNKLYVAHTSEVTVIDTGSMAIVGHVTGLNGARDVVLGPNGRGYVTSNRAATVTVFDTKTNATLATLPAGHDVNAVVYDPVSRRIFAMNDDDGTISVIDATRSKAVKTILLPGGEGLEAAVADGEGHIYLAHSAHREILRLDAKAASVDRHFAMPDCPDPSGLALDPEDNRAFVSCLRGLLVVLDTKTGRTVTTMPIGSGGQTVIYDARRRRLFSSNADNTLSVIEVDGPDSYRALPAIATLPNARTAAEDPATGRLFLPAADQLMIISPAS